MSRIGMTALIEELRSMCEAGTAEYSVGTTTYWADNSLQDILDVHRVDVNFFRLQPVPQTVEGGTLQYYEYRSPYGYLEAIGTAGTSIFYLQNSAGTVLGTTLYSVDYRRGVVTFVNDTVGTTIMMTARSYDLKASAADVWRRKASHYAPTSFNFSTDNHSVSRSQVYDHAIEMAAFFDGISNSSIQSVDRFRGDMY